MFHKIFEVKGWLQVKSVLFLIFVTILTSCSQSVRDIYQLGRDEQLANEITKKVALALRKEKDLYPCGSGGQMMHEIQMLALSFDYYKQISMEEGRCLLIAAVEKFTAAVNADIRIRPYLGNYPFRPKNVQIMIFLKNSDGSETAPDQLSALCAINAVLEYDVRDPQTTHLKTIHKESYEEALQKIQAPAA